MSAVFGRAARFAALILLVTATAGAADGKLEFNRHIRPILSDNCFQCHGPDKGNRKAKLRLDDRDTAIERGAIKPGKPEESELIRRIFETNQDDLMPPPDSHKHLTKAQKETLKRWIAEGANYEPHWAYIPPVRPAVPKIAGANASRVVNPIDAFVLHGLAAKKIPPAPEADKRTLIRRLSLDLIGLPPTIEEVAAFERDDSPQAYEHLVDRLLASPHYGERMAVPWLDVARFTDTVGYHGDQNQRIFPYRDYVIRAFNQNKPFDQFTIEQLAGDLLPNPTMEDRIATGFNRLNMMTREGGAQPKEYLAKYGADRVRTVATTWLGSTMGCCECHDHKFDPFSTRDFYSLEAFFADIKQWGVYMEYSYLPNPDLRGFSNDHPFPPEIEVDSPWLRARQEHLQADMKDVLKSVEQKRKNETAVKKAFADWRKSTEAFLKTNADGWITPLPEVRLVMKKTNAVKGTNVVVEADNSFLVTKKVSDETEVKLHCQAGWMSAIRLELLPYEGMEATNARPDLRVTMTLSAKVKPAGEGKDEPLNIRFADADRKEVRYANGAEVIGVKDGWKLAGAERTNRLTSILLLEKPRLLKTGDVVTVMLGKIGAARARVSISPIVMEPVNMTYADLLRKSLGAGWFSQNASGRSLVNEAFLLATGWNTNVWTTNLLSRYNKDAMEVLKCHDGRAFTMVTEAQKPLTVRVLPRGNWQDESGEIVQPAVPHFLPQVPNPTGRRLTRLDLAQWLVSRDNPLTARTTMNRMWKQFFGSGISAVVDDLGAQGEWPVHPELIDWLAVEFMDSGWDIKHMVKLMVMSSTYRQSSNPRPEIHELDPANRLLASQSPRRLDAEFVRDNALFISGLLNPDIGGPSAHPYQPAGYYSNIQFPERDYYADTDERQYRRGLYAHWQRTFLQPALANFDAPSREECTASRNHSNTPQQALTLLNDPTFFEASRVFAARILAGKAATDEQRLNLACEEALARKIKPDELKSLQQFLDEQRRHYQSETKEAGQLLKVGLAPEPRNVPEAELAAWTQVCRVVLNLHETITRY